MAQPAALSTDFQPISDFFTTYWGPCFPHFCQRWQSLYLRSVSSLNTNAVYNQHMCFFGCPRETNPFWFGIIIGLLSIFDLRPFLLRLNICCESVLAAWKWGEDSQPPAGYFPLEEQSLWRRHADWWAHKSCYTVQSQHLQEAPDTCSQEKR